MIKGSRVFFNVFKKNQKASKGLEPFSEPEYKRNYRKMVNMPTGSKVIVLSNEPVNDDPYYMLITTIKYWDEQHNFFIPIITDSDGKESVCFAPMILHSESTERILKGLDFKERFNLVRDIKWAL